ncbi:MAG: hypothetical protein ACYTDU_08445 [Planctomycetota bacterium]
MPDRQALADAIDRVLARYASWCEAAPPAPCVWELAERTLCWHVVLRGVVEPDIDVEVRGDALVVRAAFGDAFLQAVLPVPRPYDTRRATVRFQASVLEVRVGLEA